MRLRREQRAPQFAFGCVALGFAVKRSGAALQAAVCVACCHLSLAIRLGRAPVVGQGHTLGLGSLPSARLALPFGGATLCFGDASCRGRSRALGGSVRQGILERSSLWRWDRWKR